MTSGAPSSLRLADLAGVVLCGGESSRMGSPKAWLDFGGEPLLARVVRVVAQVTGEVVVVAAPGQDLPPLPGGVRVVRDAVSGKGPLMGLAAGLEAVAPLPAFVSSTDAPFLHPALIRRLAGLRGEEHDIAVPRAFGHHHPLAAVYASATRAEIAALLAEDRLRPFFLFERMRTLVAEPTLLLEDPALASADPELWSLRNVNTPAEYREALGDLPRAPR